jgi:hypothetical protein
MSRWPFYEQFATSGKSSHFMSNDGNKSSPDALRALSLAAATVAIGAAVISSKSPPEDARWRVALTVVAIFASAVAFFTVTYLVFCRRRSRP